MEGYPKSSLKTKAYLFSIKLYHSKKIYLYCIHLKYRIMKTILFPTDFSSYADKALEFAIEIAKKSDAKIIAVNAFYVPTVDVNIPPVLLDQMYKEEEKESESRLQNLCKRISEHSSISGRPIETEYIAAQNIPSTEITHVYKEKKPDLIVMGTEGKDHFLGFLGSTTMDVLNTAGCPVLVVGAKTSFTGFTTIYYALEDIKEDILSVKQILPLAKLFNSTIAIVHVEEPALSEEETNFSKEKIEEAESFINATKDSLSYPKITLHTILAEDVAEGLLTFTKEGKLDILALVKQERSWIENLFHKSVIKYFLRDISTPLLIIHKN